jgi:hypothetical protein
MPADTNPRTIARSRVLAVWPSDEKEASDQAEILRRVDSGAPLYRTAGPDSPPEHLCVYFALVDDASRDVPLALRAVAGEGFDGVSFRFGEVVVLGAGLGDRGHHVEVDADEAGGVAPGELDGDAGAPVAALRAVARVAEPVHELVPCVGDAGQVPAGLGWLAAEPEAGQRRAHDVERVGRVPARDGVGQRADDLAELDHRAGPAVRQDQRDRTGMRRADVDEADAEAVDLRPELRELVEPLTGGGEVVVLQPVPAQLADPVQRGALRPAAGGRGLRPPGPAQPLAQVLDVRLSNADVKGG